MSEPILLLGAEKQAASSIALAYPERSFVFLTDQPVVDGWDLPNIEIRHGSPTTFQPDQRECIVLCPRWTHPKLSEPKNRWGTFRLSVVLDKLCDQVGKVVPVFPTPEIKPSSSIIVKGDEFHRPDGALIFTDKFSEEIDDPHKAGVQYQSFYAGQKTVLAVGRRTKSAVQFGLIAVHSETCARDAWITAGETIDDVFIADTTKRMLAAMDHRGYFTFNWLLGSYLGEGGAPIRHADISSFRPVPRAVFGTLRKAGVDLLEPRGDAVAKPGVKFIVDLTYTPYRTPAA